jgi:hypothetical protein
MSRDHHPPLRDVTADTESTAFSIVVCWAMFTELLPGNALINSVTIFLIFCFLVHIQKPPEDTRRKGGPAIRKLNSVGRMFEDEIGDESHRIWNNIE